MTRFAAKPKVRRSGKWPAVRRAHLLAHPTCECCGTKKSLEVHHKKPVHADPALELDESNLITLCEGKTMNCHLWCGHLGNWKAWNVNVVADAANILKKILHRAMLGKDTAA